MQAAWVEHQQGAWPKQQAVQTSQTSSSHPEKKTALHLWQDLCLRLAGALGTDIPTAQGDGVGKALGVPLQRARRRRQQRRLATAGRAAH